MHLSIYATPYVGFLKNKEKFDNDNIYSEF